LPEPKITIIIPTRERCDVLESSLRTVTSQDYDNLDIIVCDNFSNDDTHGVVHRANDKRIRYLNTGKRLSMSHNWEHALSHVNEGWVTFIGDDDGLLPRSVATIAEIISKTCVSAIRSSFCTYDWPSIVGNTSGQLIVPSSTGIEMRSSNQWLSKVMRGQEKYNQLPMIYNGGFINISILNAIREKTGAYFRSASPDVYSAIAISRMIDFYAYVRDPLAISGTSKHSNGHSFFSVSEQRSNQPRTKFASEGNIPFHADVPLCADGSYPLSLQVCAYEAYLQSDMLGNDVKFVSPAQQLQVIMATAGKHQSSLSEWGKIFSEKHHIDFHKTSRCRSFKSRYLRLAAMTRKVLNAVNSTIVETLPITNIHEASIAAAVIRSAPSRIDTLRYLASRLAK
jgi:glycosyltransferase involved in cell wall biosynthesis